MEKILIVDDEKKVCWLIKQSIRWKEIGAKCIGTASTGIEAFAIIKKLKPDIVISDIRMPDMDGLELVRKGKEIDANCTYIIITGYRQFDYAHTALKYGVADFLLKPIDSSELNSVLYRIVAEKKKKRELQPQYLSEQSAIQERKMKARYVIHDLLKTTSLSVNSYKSMPLSFLKGVWSCIIVRVDQNTQNASQVGEDFLHHRVANILPSLFPS
ncbi:MAG TPA: response regulator, partial [Clostridiaceae bacterium]|nr:response regulator [Clostridiaceae bacterium]